MRARPYSRERGDQQMRREKDELRGVARALRAGGLLVVALLSMIGLPVLFEVYPLGAAAFVILSGVIAALPHLDRGRR